jgi:hypothetical protein
MKVSRPIAWGERENRVMMYERSVEEHSNAEQVGNEGFVTVRLHSFCNH